jgi:hypothetical protein
MGQRTIVSDCGKGQGLKETAHTALDGLLLDGKSSVEDEASNGSRQGNLLLNAEHHALVHLGHADEQSGGQSPNVIVQLADVLKKKKT